MFQVKVVLLFIQDECSSRCCSCLHTKCSLLCTYPENIRWTLFFITYVCFATLKSLVRELLGLTVFSGISAALGYSVYFTVKNRFISNHINHCIKKDQDKVVDFVDIESIDKKMVYCRCWKSKKVKRFSIFYLYRSFLCVTAHIMSTTKRLVITLVLLSSKQRRQVK